MKFDKKRFNLIMPAKIALALMLSVGGLSQVFADNRLVVHDVQLNEDGTAVVSVEMENDKNITALSTKITLPEGVTIVKQEDVYVESHPLVNFILNENRSYSQVDADGVARQRHQVTPKAQTKEASPYYVGITHFAGRPFLGNSGEVFRFTISTTGTPDWKVNGDGEQYVELGFDTIELTTDGAKAIRDDEGFKVQVKKFPTPEPLGPTAILSAPEELTVFTDGSRRLVEVMMFNNENLTAFQGRVVLPKGMTIQENGVEGYFTNAEKSMKLNISANKVGENTYNFVFSNSFDLNARAPKGEAKAPVFGFYVEADEQLATEVDPVIKFTNLRFQAELADGTRKTLRQDDFVIKVNSNNFFLDLLSDAERELNEAKASVADVRNHAAVEDDIDVLEQAAQAAFDELKAAVDQATADHKLSELDADALVAAAHNTAEALKAKAPEFLAKADAYDYIDAQQQAKADTIAAVPAELQNNEKVLAAVKTADDKIAELKQRVDDAYAAGNLVGTDLTNQKQAVEDAIAAIAAVADEQEKLLEQAALREKVDADLAALTNRLNTVEEIINGYPTELKDEFADDIQAIRDAIQAEKDALAAKTELTEDDVVDADGDIAQSITDLNTNAQAEKAKYDTNKQYYEKFKAELEAQEAALEAARQEIADEDADVAEDFEEALNDVADLIADKKQELEQKNADRLLDGASESGAAEIAEAIAAVKADAAAKQAEEDAYAQKAADAIEELNGKLADALEQVNALDINPSIKEEFEETVNEAKAEVDALSTFAEDNDGKLRKLADELQQKIDAANDAVDAVVAEAQETAEDAARNAALKDEYLEKVQTLQDKLDELKGELQAMLDNEDLTILEESQEYQDLLDQIDDLQGEIDNLEWIIDFGAGNLALDDSQEDLDALDEYIDQLQDSIDAVETAEEKVANSYKRGNVSGDLDGDVDLEDFDAWIDQIDELESNGVDYNADTQWQEQNAELFKKLDVNGDGDIDIADLQAISNLSNFGKLNPLAAARVMSSLNEVLTAENSANGMALALTSNAEYAALQADITLAEGAQLRNVNLTERTKGYNLTTTTLADGTIRVRVFSMRAGKVFSGNEGALLNLDINGQASISNVILADANAQSHKLQLAAAGTTGISSVSAKAEGSTVYNIGGRVMNAIQKGINIIRRNDGSAQKVIK